MADDAGITLLLAAALDVALTRGAKRHLWVRVVNAVFALIFLVIIGGLIYITFKYS